MLLLWAAFPATAHEAEVSAAPPPAFAAPAPGSYALPVIDRVPEHTLLDAEGREVPLLGLAAGQAALVSFAYTRCPQGCPVSTSALKRLDARLARSSLAERVRLVTVSFDPERDTPAGMRAYRDALQPRSDWRFLTARDDAQIEPVLADYGQDRTVLRDAEGVPTGVIRHVLKVFLIDDQRAVRNIYSADYLFPELLLADLETLLGDPAAVTPRPGSGTGPVH